MTLNVDARHSDGKQRIEISTFAPYKFRLWPAKEGNHAVLRIRGDSDEAAVRVFMTPDELDALRSAIAETLDESAAKTARETDGVA